MSGGWPDIYDEGYIYQLQPEALILKNSAMDHLSNDLKGHPNQHKNSHKLCGKTWHSILSLMESQWKLRQPNDQNFAMEGKPL